jgi:hypothetical protein
MAELVIKLVNGELAGKTAQSLTKEINAAAMAAKKAEVGTKEWIDAHARLDKAKSLQQDLTKQINSTKNASDQLKAAWNKLPGAGFFNQIGESFGMMKSGVGGLVSSFGMLKAAIAATGIGLLVIAVATLVDWFRKTDEGATLLAGIMRGLEAIMDKATATVRELGGWLVKAAENPKQAFKDFVDFLKDQVMNRINAFAVAAEGVSRLLDGDFSGGMKKLADATIQFQLGITDGTDKLMKFGEEIAATVAEGVALEAELDRIADRARELSVLDAETHKNVEQLILQSKNVGKTYEERIALLDKAGQIETANHAQQLKNAIDLENAMQREVDQKMAVGKVSDELDQKLKDAQIARINLDRESINLQEKIANRRTALMEKEAAERERDAQKQMKVNDDLAKESQKIQDLQLQAKADSRAKDLEGLQLSLMRQLEALDQNSALYNEHVKAITEAGRAQRDAINAQWDEKEVKAADDTAQKVLQAREDAYEADQAKLLISLANKEITRREFDMLAEQNQLQFFNDQLTTLEEQGLQETEAYRRIQDAKVQMELDAQERIKQARKATFDAAVTFANAALDNEIAAIQRQNEASQQRLEKIKAQYGEESSAYKNAQAQIEIERKKNGERIKKFERTKVKINLLSEIANIWLNANSFPFPYSAIIGGLLSGAAILRANKAIEGINSQQYEKGGLLHGPRHSNGGIPIEAEGGEFIFSRKATAAIGSDQLSSINDFYTQRFATGGPVNPFASSAPSGPVSKASSAPAFSPANDMLASKIDELIAAQDRRVDRIKVQNVVTETEDALKTVNQIKADADF